MTAMIACTGFGTLANGEQASLFTLVGRDGVRASFTDYGARLVSLIVPDHKGAPGDIVLSCRDACDLQTDGSSIGATIGRVAGRIGNSVFDLDGTRYHLPANEGPPSPPRWSCGVWPAKVVG